MKIEGNRTTIVIVGIVCLVLGYFVGREHLKYQVRSAMQNAFSQMQSGVPSPSNSSTDAPPTPPAEKAKTEPSPITVTLLKKGFSPRDIHAEKFDDDITFSLEFKNKTGRDIRAFDGYLEFTDLLGNSIHTSKLAINERIAKAAILSWEGSLRYNQFMADHQRLRNEGQENLKVNFTVNKVLFDDGTTKDYSSTE